MRIITGIAKGVRLSTLEGLDTRPTPERVKEAVFSMLQFDLEGRKVLDLFAGSGQMALEALSRGAASAVLLDENPQAVNIIKENAKKTKLFPQCNILCTDASAYLRNRSGKERFDLIFMDPPYAQKIMSKMLHQLSRADILAPRAIIICETEDELPPDTPDTFDFVKHVKYGRVYITVFTKKEEG